MTMTSPKSFADATTIKQLSSHTYSADFPSDWCIGNVPHGGFVTSCFLRVASTHFQHTLSKQNQPHTLTLHLDFLRRTQIGPALFTVQDTKLGRQTSIIHITLSQDSRQEVVGYITNSNLHEEKGVTLHTRYQLHPPPSSVFLAALKADHDENWALADIPYKDFRRAQLKTKFYLPRNGQAEKSFADEWITLSDGSKWTQESLGFVSDTFPLLASAWFDGPDGKKGKTAQAYWYPTLLLNLEVKKALPEEGVEWLFLRVRAKQIKNGRMDLEVIVLDGDGDLVLLSHHVCFILGAERNLAARRVEESKI